MKLTPSCTGILIALFSQLLHRLKSNNNYNFQKRKCSVQTLSHQWPNAAIHAMMLSAIWVIPVLFPFTSSGTTLAVTNKHQPSENRTVCIYNNDTVPKSANASDIEMKRQRRIEHQKQSVITSVSRLKVPAGGLVPGDSLPDAFWDLKLQVVNSPLQFTDFSEYRDKLLILDFWATYCTPCVASVDQLNELQQEYRQEIVVLPVHLFDYQSKALPFALKKGWKLPIAVGKGDTVLNKLFFAYKRFGLVWIWNGKLLAIPKNSMATRENIIKLFTNQPLQIEMDDYLTYFDKRYKIQGKGDHHD